MRRAERGWKATRLATHEALVVWPFLLWNPPTPFMEKNGRCAASATTRRLREPCRIPVCIWRSGSAWRGAGVCRDKKSPPAWPAGGGIRRYLWFSGSLAEGVTQLDQSGCCVMGGLTRRRGRPKKLPGPPGRGVAELSQPKSIRRDRVSGEGATSRPHVAVNLRPNCFWLN